MSKVPATHIQLFNYRAIYLALEAPLGKHPFNTLDQLVEDHTGRSEHTFYMQDAGAPKVVRYIGATLTGVGPKMVRKERQRLLELQLHVERALKEVDGFLEHFEDNKS